MWKKREWDFARIVFFVTRYSNEAGLFLVNYSKSAISPSVVVESSSPGRVAFSGIRPPLNDTVSLMNDISSCSELMFMGQLCATLNAG